VAKKVTTKDFGHFLSNGLEFYYEILQIYIGIIDVHIVSVNKHLNLSEIYKHHVVQGAAKKVAPQSFLLFSRQLFGVLSNFFYKFIY